MNHESNQSGQLELDAFRFASGEMSANERALFEDRLASEPGVAAVLSQVLEMEPLVESTFDPQPAVMPAMRAAPTVAPVVSPARSVLPIVVALAACVVLAVVIAPSRTTPTSVTVARLEQVPPVTEQPVELVENWLEVADLTSLDPLPGEPEDDAVMELAMLDPADAFDADPDEFVPDWLVDAVQEKNSLEVGIE